MNLFSLLAGVVFASEGIISPLADSYLPSSNPTVIQIQTMTFGQLNSSAHQPELLGQSTEQIQPIPTPVPTIKSLRARKKNYTIALLGDSMIDTLGPGISHLKDELVKLYPKVKFNLLNYGVGGTNIDYGIQRLTSDYLYLGNRIPSLVSQNPDIVVVESFCYNPYSFDEGVFEKHWLALAKIVDILKDRLPNVKIVIASTIAPNAKVFGDGAPNLSYDTTGKYQKVATIKKYLENALRFAQSQKLPFADAFHPSLDKEGNGQEVYINAGDHIHYSDAGRKFFAQKIAETLVTSKLLE